MHPASDRVTLKATGVDISTQRSDFTLAAGPEALPIPCKSLKSIQLTLAMIGESHGERIALQTGVAAGKDNRSMAHSEDKSQNA